VARDPHRLLAMASSIADSRKFWQEKDETPPRKSLTVPEKESPTLGLRSAEKLTPSSDASREDHKQSLDKLFAQFQQKHKRDKSARHAAQAVLSDRRRQMEAVIESLKHKQAEEAFLEATAEARVMEAESKAELATVKASQMISQLYVHAAIESDAAALDALAQTRGAVVAIEDKKDRVPDLIAKLVEAELPDDSKSAVAGALGRPAIADVVKRLINSQIQDAVAEATLRQIAAEAKLEATLRQVAARRNLSLEGLGLWGKQPLWFPAWQVWGAERLAPYSVLQPGQRAAYRLHPSHWAFPSL